MHYVVQCLVTLLWTQAALYIHSRVQFWIVIMSCCVFLSYCRLSSASASGTSGCGQKGLLPLPHWWEHQWLFQYDSLASFLSSARAGHLDATHGQRPRWVRGGGRRRKLSRSNDPVSSWSLMVTILEQVSHSTFRSFSTKDLLDQAHCIFVFPITECLHCCTCPSKSRCLCCVVSGVLSECCVVKWNSLYHLHRVRRAS